MSQAKRVKKLPPHLIGCFAEDIARVLMVSVETAQAMKEAATAAHHRVLHENACVRGERSSELLAS